MAKLALQLDLVELKLVGKDIICRLDVELQLDLVELKWRNPAAKRQTGPASIGPCGIEMTNGRTFDRVLAAHQPYGPITW